MALEAVVYQNALYGHYDINNKELYNMQQNWSLEDQEYYYNNNNNGYFECQDQDPWELFPSHEWSTTPDSSEGNFLRYDTLIAPPPPPNTESTTPDQCAFATSSSSSRPKRRCVRTKKKNKEEIENQRMTHIAVERNRRKQMNEYLAILKSLMPNSYVQRSDQASIVGGAINYVKELEQNLHTLNAQKSPSLPFKEFISFPQYTMETETHMEVEDERVHGVADVEVAMIESHANLKIRSKKHPNQLLKLVNGLHSLRLNILHLNVTTMDQFALYSISVKVDDDSKLSSMDEVATAVHQLLGRIQEEAIA